MAKKTKASADTLPTNPNPNLPTTGQRRPRLSDAQEAAPPVGPPAQPEQPPVPPRQPALVQPDPPQPEPPPTLIGANAGEPVPFFSPVHLDRAMAGESAPKAAPEQFVTPCSSWSQDQDGEIPDRTYAVLGRALIWSRRLGVDMREFMLLCMELCDGDALALLDLYSQGE